MDNGEALRLLEEALAAFRAESYEQLVRHIDAVRICAERIGPSSTRYQLEFSFVWDDRPGGNVRVLGSIDDGRWQHERLQPRR